MMFVMNRSYSQRSTTLARLVGGRRPANLQQNKWFKHKAPSEQMENQMENNGTKEERAKKDSEFLFGVVKF